MTFDIAISLGNSCQSRYNISRTLYLRARGRDDGFSIGENRKSFLVPDYGSFFFDWSVTPIRSVIAILNSNFKNVLELENLQINTLPNGLQTILDQATGCSYPHTFPQTEVGNCTPIILSESYGQIKEKYEYVVKKTIEVLSSDKHLLFVLNGNHSDEAVLEVCDAIELYTEKYQLLYTPWSNWPIYGENSTLKKDSRLIIRPIKHEPYPGDFRSWDKAFDGIDLKFP